MFFWSLNLFFQHLELELILWRLNLCFQGLELKLSEGSRSQSLAARAVTTRKSVKVCICRREDPHAADAMQGAYACCSSPCSDSVVTTYGSLPATRQCAVDGPTEIKGSHKSLYSFSLCLYAALNLNTPSSCFLFLISMLQWRPYICLYTPLHICLYTALNPAKSL